MKKISIKRKLHLLRVQRKRENKIRKTKSHHILEPKLTNYHRLKLSRKTSLVSQKILLPEFFSIGSNFNETMLFVKTLREYINEGYIIEVDFVPLKKIGSASALLLASELDRWRRRQNKRLRVLNSQDWDPEITALLNDMGLFNVLEAGNSPICDINLSRDVHFIPFRSHKFVEGSEAVRLFESLSAIGADIKDDKKYLFRGLTEAMTNVVQHAYPTGGTYETPPLHNRWWMSGSFYVRKRRITVTFIDQGVGIPSTLTKKHSMEHVLGWLSNLGLYDNDAERIGAAMELGRSQTHLPHRGTGLVNIREYIDILREGELRIFSGKGEYKYRHNQKALFVNHNYSLGGTLIQWSGLI